MEFQIHRLWSPNNAHEAVVSMRKKKYEDLRSIYHADMWARNMILIRRRDFGKGAGIFRSMCTLIGSRAVSTFDV